MPGATTKHATITPTPTPTPIPTPGVAQAHRESREQQGTTLAQTTGRQSRYPLRCLATSLDALTAGDVATEPGALAFRAWAESTRRN